MTVVEQAPPRPIGKTELLKRLAAMKPSLNALGVSHLALFGSRARNDHRIHSDVDVLIELFENQTKFSLFDLVGIQNKLADDIGVPFSVVMRRSMTPRFSAAIQEDIVEIF